jgi:hypothetical protein
MLPVLLIILFILVEAAFIIQGYLAVQHAAREAARWAVSYRPVQGQKLSDEDYCKEDGAGLPQSVGAFFDEGLNLEAGDDCYLDESDEEYRNRRVALIKETAPARRWSRWRAGAGQRRSVYDRRRASEPPSVLNWSEQDAP